MVCRARPADVECHSAFVRERRGRRKLRRGGRAVLYERRLLFRLEACLTNLEQIEPSRNIAEQSARLRELFWSRPPVRLPQRPLARAPISVAEWSGGPA